MKSRRKKPRREKPRRKKPQRKEPRRKEPRRKKPRRKSFGGKLLLFNITILLYQMLRVLRSDITSHATNGRNKNTKKRESVSKSVFEKLLV